MQVLLLDDDDDLREGMKWMFETVDLPMQGFATFEGFKNRLDEYVNSDAGLCLLLDLRMPDMSGLEVFEWLKRSGYSLDRLPVIFLTGHGDISTAVEAVKNGAFDFYEKPTTDQRLVERVKQALQKSGEFLVNLEVLKQWSERIARLSPREREVMFLVAKGKLNKVIASLGKLLFDCVQAFLRKASFGGRRGELFLKAREICLCGSILGGKPVARLLNDTCFLFLGFDGFCGGL